MDVDGFLNDLPHRYFDENQLHAFLVSEIRDYMMIAWYFAAALAKQYEAALPYLENRRLAPWTHNKAIQKLLESCRILPERKEYLRGLKISAAKQSG